MEFKDYYKILGVDPEADDKTIKTAYRKLARKFHPDMNAEEGAEDKFKEVAEAYEVLKDSGRRAEFDELRRYGGQFKGGGFEPPPGWQRSRRAGTQSNQFEGDFSDFFNSIFGNRGGGFDRSGFSKKNVVRGRDAEIEIPLFLEEAVKNESKTVEYSIPSYQNGRVSQLKKHLKVKMPKGVKDGERVRLKGQGAPAPAGGEAGDLYLHIRLVPHPLFDVQGRDLVVTVPLAPWEAALGTKVTVPTLEGKINLTITPDTQAGKKLRIKGKGLPAKVGQGDLIALVKIVMPTTSNEKTNQLWQELSTAAQFDPRSEWSN